MSLKKVNKLYPVEDSPFYLLKGKGQFEKLFSVKWTSLDALLSSKGFYRVFINEAGREIQYPIRSMARIHRRIAELLARIQVPNYLVSPRKVFSYIDNAKMHIVKKKLVKTDISKFYPSITFQMVYQMFLEIFQCAKDIAIILAKICCFEQKHLPTGSPLSGRVAFFSAKKFLMKLNK